MHCKAPIDDLFIVCLRTPHSDSMSLRLGAAFLPLDVAVPSSLDALDGTGFTIIGPVSSPKSSIAFQSAVNVLSSGGSALCLVHASSVHQAVRTATPLDSLQTKQLEQLEFVYVNTLQECLVALSSIGLEGYTDGPHLPDLLLVDLAAMEDAGDTYHVGAVLALLDNTIRYIRTSHNIAAYSVAVLAPVSVPSYASLAPRPLFHIQCCFPMSCVPNPTIDARPSSHASHNVELFVASSPTGALDPSIATLAQGYRFATFSYHDDCIDVEMHTPETE